LGADLLNGGAGRDTFVFDTKLGKGEVDTIQGFNPLEDRILLDSAVFKKLGDPGILDRDALRWGGNAIDANDRILYDLATGTLSYDADGSGSGAAVKFAKIDPWLWLTHDSFRII
jgi:Ca2+-binding RTX toxin-like protein